MNYRTTTLICVGCEHEIKYRHACEPKWRGSFRQAISAKYCPRCQSIQSLANEGDTFCKKYVDSHLGAYA